MNFSKSINFSKLTLMLAFCLLFTAACSDEEDPISAPPELSVEQVANVIFSNKLGVEVSGFVQTVNYHNQNTIKITSIDNQELYYRLDEEKELFSITTEIGQQENLISPKSSVSEAGGGVECRNRVSNGDGTYTNYYVECGIFTCYLHEDQVSSSGAVINPDPQPTYLGLSFPWLVNRYCNRLEIVSL